MAAGASMVGLGRMQCIGLAADGQDGLVRMLEILEQEVHICMGLLGVTAWNQLDRSYLHAAPPASDGSVLSAFPLISPDAQSLY
jgi:glycolate oxidase